MYPPWSTIYSLAILLICRQSWPFRRGLLRSEQCILLLSLLFLIIPSFDLPVFGGLPWFVLLEPDHQHIAGWSDILPPKVGGSKVHLLIGIKNAKLTPILERVLDSGVAVFSSPFTDIFGSNKIFAGPHKCFTSGNKGLKSHAVYHFGKQILETRRLIDENFEDELGVEENREHTIILSEELKLSIHPRPITDEDA